MRGSESPTGVRKKQCQTEQAGEEQKREKGAGKEREKWQTQGKLKLFLRHGFGD